MPRIEEYLPQVEASGPVGGTSPNLDQVQAAGRGISDFGTDLTQSLDLVQRRQEQAETSQASATFSDLRASYNQQIQDGVQKGTLDSQAIVDQYDKDVADQYDSYSTPGGKDYFNRQAARLRGTVLRNSMHGQATVAANNAKSDWTTSLNNDQNTVTSDPTQFGDVLDSYQERAGAMVDNGAVSDHDSDTMVQDAGKKLSYAAVRGIMQSDYNRATAQAQQVIDQQGADALPKAEALEAAVSGFKSATTKMADGSYDDYLSGNDKKALASEEVQTQNRAVAEINRLITVNKAAAQEQAQNWGDQAWMKMHSNQLTGDMIAKAPLTWQQKQEWTDLLKRSTGEQSTDPAYWNQLVNKVVTGQLTDPMAVPALVRSGQLSTQDAEKLQKFIDTTPGGQALNFNRKQLLDVAKSSLVKANPMIGEADPKGEFNMAQFTQDLQHAEQNLRSQKQSVAPLYDTSSPQYFATPQRLQKYQRSQQEIMTDLSNQMTGNFTKPVLSQNNPGVTAPTPAPKTLEGQAGTSKSGKPMVFKNGQWIYK